METTVLFNTSAETQLMAELGDLEPELASIRSVFAEQTEVMQQLAKIISREWGKSVEEIQEGYDQWYRSIHSFVDQNLKDVLKIDARARNVEERVSDS